MRSPKNRLHRVLVVGAAPAGVAAANKLSELGIPVTLVDEDADLNAKPAIETYRLKSGVPLNFAHRADDPRVRQAVNACLTCGVCYERCPSAVNFPEFIKDMRTMAAADIPPRRWRERPATIKTQSKSDVLFFGGCAPYVDIFLRKFPGVDTSGILDAANRVSVKSVKISRK